MKNFGEVVEGEQFRIARLRTSSIDLRAGVTEAPSLLAFLTHSSPWPLPLFSGLILYNQIPRSCRNNTFLIITFTQLGRFQLI